MLAPPPAAGPAGGAFSAPLSARGPRRLPAQGFRVKDGLSIAPLRATSGPPAGLGAGPSVLVEPPPAGQGVLDQLQGQVHSPSPLVAGVAQTFHRSPAADLPALQARATALMGRLRQADERSRLLLAQGNPQRGKGGFGTRLATSRLSLLG